MHHGGYCRSFVSVRVASNMIEGEQGQGFRAARILRESMMSFFMIGLLALVVLPQPLKLSSCTYWLVSVI